MGTVHAKEPASIPKDIRSPLDDSIARKKNDGLKDSDLSSHFNNYQDSALMDQPPPRRTKAIHLQKLKARVDKIHIDGLRRTKDDIIEAQVSELFKAHDFQDVIIRAHKVQGKLEALGCFTDVGVFIDTSEGPGATPDGVEVTFTVKEMKRLMGGVNTMVGNNEGSLIIGARAPNIFGRGERVQMEYSYGSKSSTNVNISVVKPFVDSWIHKVLTASIFNSTSDFPWSGYKLTENGFLLDMTVNSEELSGSKHNFQYEAAYREISAYKQASFRVREQCGPNLKSALRHILSLDRRDESIFPTVGSLLQFTTEVAGLGGNIGFVKNELIMQNNWTLFDYFTIQLGVQSGLLRGISNDMQISISDQFFLGGPLNLRGFEMRGCGPRHDGNSLGGDIYWAMALHLYTPLPFNRNHNSFMNLFRLHGFVNGGNLTNAALKFGGDYRENFKIFSDNVRCSAGGGLVMKLGNVARVELNIVIPLMFLRSDLLQQFQFGIGLQYL